jgi:hypothetical protein
MGNSPEQQIDREDLSPEEKKIASEILKAERAVGLEHPELLEVRPNKNNLT